MSMTTLSQSPDEFEVEEEKDTSRGQVNTATDNNILDDTQLVDSFEAQKSNEQSNKHNLTIWEDEDGDRVNKDKVPSHVFIETVQYEEYVKQKDGGEIVEIEDGKDGDNIEVIQLDDDDEEEDGEEEVIFQSIKPPRESRPTTSSDTQPKQIITLTRQCPQVGCLEMIAKDEFTAHLWGKHSIRKFQCPVKDCKQSFDNTYKQRQHRVLSHQSTSQWQCGKCSKHFTSYKHLSDHNFKYHQLGHFQCSFPDCPFTGEYRRKVTNHYAQAHSKTVECGHAGCNFQSSNSSHLRQHQRIHLGIKPYSCKWPQCHFVCARKFDTIRHILSRHFARNQSSVPNGAQLGDPQDYVEMVNEVE